MHRQIGRGVRVVTSGKERGQGGWGGKQGLSLFIASTLPMFELLQHVVFVCSFIRKEKEF